MDRKPLVAAALAGLLALGANTAMAQDKKGEEKCWGVAKAGQNDCANSKAGHNCAGLSKKDYDPNDYKMVKTGTCIQMGGSLKEGQAGMKAKEKMKG
ncbi:MAG TPA: DUF2282 domain-containing protein [Burkholderiales bacterium]|nr:DUF2282 domain-containing protein [Burkholderiales bacterium]